MTSLDSLVVEIGRKYHKHLAQFGISADPTQRTPDQQATAVVEFWAIQNSFLLTVAGLTIENFGG